MSFGIPISAPGQQRGCLTGLIIATVFGLIFGGFILFFFWYTSEEVSYKRTKKKLEKLVAGNPTKDANKAIEDEDFRLYSSYDFTVLVPGAPGVVSDDRRGFTCRGISLLKKEMLSEEEKKLNNDVLYYVTKYNMTIYAYCKGKIK